MKKLIILAVAALIALPTAALADTFSFRVGYFFPRADSDLWTTEFDNLSLKRSDYQSTIFGLSYEHFFNSFLSVVVAADTYSKTKSGYYLDWVGYSFAEGDFAFPASEFGGAYSLIQTFSVSTLPIQVSLKVTPLGRRGSFIPYFGGGAALNIWSTRIYGDMVDFSDASWAYDDADLGEVQIYPVYIVDARDRTKFGVSYQGFAGIMVPVGTRMTVEGEFKYTVAKAELTDIQGFQPLDLSGFQVSIGLNYWF